MITSGLARDPIFSEGIDSALSSLQQLESEHGGTASQYDVADFFSGCGGLSFGFHALGNVVPSFNVIGAFDLYDHANRTYAANFGLEPTPLDLGALAPGEVAAALGAGKRSRELVVVGGPPCQGFSALRKGSKAKDPRNSLVRHYAEVSVEADASVVVMENVPDLLSERHWHHFAGFRDTLEAAGYNVAAGILNMAEFGVPQERFRTVVIAARGFVPTLPTPIYSRNTFRTVRDAIGDMPPLEPGQADPNDAMHVTSRHRQETVEIIRQVPHDGGSRPSGVGPKCLDDVSGFYDVYGRLFWDKPAVTITARCRTPSCGRFAHPEQDRGLSVREAALLQGFPRAFRFEGPFDDKFKQIGNAVPPLFSLHLATHVRAMLLGAYHGQLDVQRGPSKPPFKSFSGIIGGLKRRGQISLLNGLLPTEGINFSKAEAVPCVISRQ